MPVIEPNGIVEPVTKPRHYTPPTKRELRGQAVHRLQVGLFGLCGMLLLVGLANIIMDRARPAAGDEPIEDVIAVDEEPKKPGSDPLADIGVVPSADPSPSPSPSPSVLPSDSQLEPADPLIEE